VDFCFFWPETGDEKRLGVKVPDWGDQKKNIGGSRETITFSRQKKGAIEAAKAAKREVGGCPTSINGKISKNRG